MAEQPASSSFDMGSLEAFIQRQAEIQEYLATQVKELQGKLAVVEGKQAVQEPAILMPSFAAHKIKLDLPPKFSGKPNELSGWVFSVEQYCEMVGLAKPTDIVRLAVSRLEGDAFTWWRQLTQRGEAYELGTLAWSDFKSEIVDAFMDVDRELKLRRKLASLRQSTSVAAYVKQFRQTILELGEQAPDDSALLFMFMEGLKPDVQMQVLLARPNLLSEAEQVAERADMALFAVGKRQQQFKQPQHPQQQPWQQPWQRQQYRIVKPPPPPPRQGPMPMELGAIQEQQPHWQAKGTSARQIVCYRCGKAGHIAKNCRVRLGGQPNQKPSFNWVQSQQPPLQYVQPAQAQPFPQYQTSAPFMHMQAQSQAVSQQQFQQQQPQLPSPPPLNDQRDRY